MSSILLFVQKIAFDSLFAPEFENLTITLTSHTFSIFLSKEFSSKQKNFLWNEQDQLEKFHKLMWIKQVILL